MKKVSISDAKNGLSALIKEVGEGQAVYICDRGKPVAKLEPIVFDPQSDDALDELEALGIIRKGTGKYPEIRLEDLPKTSTPDAAIKAVLKDREEGW